VGFGGSWLEQCVRDLRLLLRVYNNKGIFSNLDDSEMGLREALEKSFSDVQIQRVGVVALFEARRPK